MKRIQNMCIIVLAGLICLAGSANAQVTSALWGVDGDSWDPTNSILRDFTQVGYKGGGTNSIPNWPVGVVVTNFGAIPDDGIDDSQAFNDAIAACPDYHAVLVPKGEFTILQKIEPQRDHFVLRGEDMYESVLFFPKYLSEVYIDEIGYADGVRNPVYGGFFIWSGGVEKSIETLTFEFREERKNGDWDYPGAQAVSVQGVSDGWFRDLYFRNVDSAIALNGTRISVLNIFIDQFNGRQNVEHKLDAYGGILPRNISYSLFHNIHVTGRLLQPIDLNEASSHNVYSQYRGGELNDRSASYHGGSSHFDLYTDLDKGVVRPSDHPSRSDETFWNVDDTSDFYATVWEEVYNSTNSLILVGVGDDWPLKTTDSLWYEPADYGLMTPANLYLAQMQTFGYPLPEAAPAPIPAPYEKDGDMFRILPTDDITPGNAPDGGLKPSSAYFKFDLTQANETNIAHARLRLTHGQIKNAPYKLTVWSVTDDNWSEESLTTSNAPAVVTELDSEWVMDMENNLVVEFDVSDFVRNEAIGGDGVVSLHVNITEGGSGFLSSIWSSEQGVHPELIVGRVADPVPGAPGAPKGIRSTPLVGNIILDWDDNPESDTATYTVYRTPYAFGTLPIAGGLVTSDHVDTSSITSWRSGMMEHDKVYHYWIAVVDDHGYESEKSLEFVAATLHPSNDPPAFAGTVSLSNAIAHEAYSESLAGEASDPESDQLYFMKVSGPDWLNVALDGTLSGSPAWSDEGTNAFTFQVTAIGGSTQKVVNITVDLPADDPPGAPAAPAGLAALTGLDSVSLDWDDNAEADIRYYSVYRSTNSGSGYSLVANRLTVSGFVDSNAVNGVTNYYVVTALDKNGNESSTSSEVSALPGVDLTPPAVPSGLTATPYNGSVTLGWNDNTDDDLAGYNIYRSEISGSYGSALVTNLSPSAYIDTNVVNGTTYYYVVTATDTNSNESANSSEVSATPDASIVSINYDFGSGADSIATAGLTLWLEDADLAPKGMCIEDVEDGISVLHRSGDGAKQSQGFYRTFGGLEPGAADDFVITTTFTTPTVNWNSPSIGIHLFGDSTLGTSSSFLNTGIYASIDSKKNLDIFGGGVENDPKLSSGIIAEQVLNASTTTIEVKGTYGTYGTGNLQLVLTVSQPGAATNSITAIVDTTGFAATDNGFGISADSDDNNEFVVKTFSLDFGSGVPSSGYDAWAASWSNNIGSATNDFDSDGMNNLYEYAMDGNPTNGLAPTNLPVFTRFGNGFIYVHPKRSDDTSLIYTVETTTNLVSGIWTNQGYTVTGTRVTGGTLNFVTNEVDTVESEKFIRLRIE